LHATAQLMETRLGPQAELVFSSAPDGRTFISHQRVGYPFHITRPFYLDRYPSELLTLYLQSVSGGIYRGEKLEMSLEAEAGALAQVTTQSATIVHRMKDGADACQHMTMRAAEGAHLEYLPDPLILFPGAKFETKLGVIAAPGSSVIIQDAFTQHDSEGAGRRFERLVSDTRIERPDGTLLAFDRFDVGGDFSEAHLDDAGGVSYPSHGTIMAVYDRCPADELANCLREALNGCQGVYVGASTLPNDCGAWGRVLAEDGHALRVALNVGWRVLRTKITGGEPAVRPK